MARGNQSGIRSHGTDVGGNCYIHPRSDKYRENFDKIKWNRCNSDCGDKCCSITGEQCCKETDNG